MKIRTNRITAFALAALLLSMSACGNNTDSDVSDDTSDLLDTIDTNLNTDGTVDRGSVSDGLGSRDYDGAIVNIAINTFCEDGFFKEEQSGDVLDDAIYNRNKTIEERFNVTLNYISKDYIETKTNVINSVTSGDDEYQIVAEHAIYAGEFVTGGLVKNWYDIPNVDFSKPWWSPSNINDLTVDGVCLLAIGDFALTTIGRTYCMAYDITAGDNYNLPDIYELIYDGKWTFDKLSELIRGTYSDLNMNNERDTDDYYGYSTSVSSKIGTFLWAFDNPIYKKEPNGTLTMSMNVEKMSSILEKLVSFCWDDPDVYYDVKYKSGTSDMHYVSEEKFAAGTSLFSSIMIESGIKYFRDMNNDYGIIPYPKWDEAQDDYYTMVDGGFSALAIPKTVENVEMVGAVIEALCAETYRSVIPVYYDKALKEKGTRNEESKEMIDFVISKRIFDFGYVFDNWKGFGFKLEGMVKARNINFASTYASEINSVNEHYDSVLECFKAEK
ncbi:MAG: hypothetical protein HFE63_09200 [Clostridiales bacterium]|nr:hypothetical protein [Clostridiales bacterium]